MILWLLLFLLIVAISFVLAYQSMKDFQEIPVVSDKYSLYLLRQDLTAQLLTDLTLALKGYVFGVERLFKGEREALVVFGPKKVLDNLSSNFNLLELEDYTQNISEDKVTIIEMGVRGDKGISPFIPKLEDKEQFWLQMVFATNESWWDHLSNLFRQLIVLTKGEKVVASELQKRRVESLEQSQRGKEPLKYQIRVVVVSDDPKRREELLGGFENLSKEVLIKIPRPYMGTKALSFYKNRVFNASKLDQNITTPQATVILTS